MQRPTDQTHIHGTIKERFRPFSETRRSLLVEALILDTMGELLAGDRPKELSKLKVVMLVRSQQFYLTASELRIRKLLLYQRALGSIGMVEIG